LFWLELLLVHKRHNKRRTSVLTLNAIATIS